MRLWRRVRASFERIAVELRYLDYRWIRRHFCMQCDKPTFLTHDHHASNLAAFRRIVGKEWRP